MDKRADIFMENQIGLLLNYDPTPDFRRKTITWEK